MAKTQAKKSTKPKANPGLMIGAGEIEASDFDNSVSWTDLIQDYTDMRNGDCIASSTIDILKMPILQSAYRINTDGKDDKSKKARDYIDYCFDNIHGGFQKFKYHLLLSLDYGLSMNEMVFSLGEKYEGYTTNRLSRIVPIQLDTINKFLFDKYAEFLGIEHERREPEGASSFIEIGADKLFWCSYNEEFYDIRGRSVYRTARKAFKYKQVVMDSTARASQRGAGIPYGKLKGNASSDDKANAQKVLRTLSNAKNGYVLGQIDNFEVELLELKNQGNNMPLLEYFDRQMFFNSLSQFMTAGIGQNGSRAATGEHKASYELAANYILKYLKEDMQGLVNTMIANSPFYDLPSESYPTIEFDAITQVDLSKVAANLKAVKDMGGVKWTVEDEIYFREMFNLPDYNPEAEPVNKPLPMTPGQDSADDNEDEKKQPEENKTKEEKPEEQLTALQSGLRKLTAEQKESHENNILELESANEHYMTMKEKALVSLDTVFNKILKDAASQLKKNPKANIELRYERELVKEMTKLFEEGYIRGERDFNKELDKLRKGSTNLAVSPSSKSAKNKSIERWVARFFFDVKTTLEDQVSKKSIAYINSKGGMEEYVLGFETGFKTDKRQVLREVEAGYMVGRGTSLKLAKEEIATYLYSSRLDGDLCDSCAPFDGLIMTFKEMIDNFIDPYGKPVNLECLGREDCRCILIPFELEGVN